MSESLNDERKRSTAAAAARIQRAMVLVETAQGNLERAAAEVSSVVGLAPEWTVLANLYDRVKASWYRLERRLVAGKFDLDASAKARLTGAVLVLAFGSTLAAGCATMSNRTKTLLLMGGAGIAAGTAGALLAPAGERQGLHAVLWAGAAAAGAGAAGLFLFDEEAKRREAEVRAAKLEKELGSFGEETAPELLATNRLGVEKPLPAKFRHLVTPGQWSLYKVDRWLSSNDSELVHQDMIFRFNQPQLNPSGKPLAGAGLETKPTGEKTNGTNQ